MAIITTTAPLFYIQGISGASNIVGQESDRNRVARYSFTVPAGVTASKISCNFGQIYAGSGNPVIRYKVNQNADSYANANGGAGFSYDGTVETYQSGSLYYARIVDGNITINGPGTYYLWLFPASLNNAYWSWNSNATSLTITEARIYQLTLNKADHTTLEVKRDGIVLNNGANITYGDVLSITFDGDPGFLASATLNGSPILSGATHTVTGNVTVATTATALGLVYIDDGTQFVAAQVFIDNGSDWEQYMPYIDNGTEFELYT